MSKHLSRLIAKKATESDQIPPQLLKPAAIHITNYLTDAFNETIINGQFPSGAKRAEVRPLYKKKDLLDKKNYHPISILNSTSKVFESFINK